MTVVLLAYLGMVGTPLNFEQCTQLTTSQPVICEDHAGDGSVDGKNGSVHVLESGVIKARQKGTECK